MARNLLSRDMNKKTSPLGRKMYMLIRAANFDYIKDFEQISGVRPDSIRRLIGGYTKSLPYPDLEKAAKALKISVNELMNDNGAENTISTASLVPGAINPCWFQVHSDEMLPTLKSGDNVLVDIGIRNFSGAGIYLLGLPHVPTFRRISLNPLNGRVKVNADNSTYDYSEETDISELQINGKVIGIFQRM